MKVKFPPVLLYNVYAYCLAPSVLAIIPVVGPALAIVWIFALLVYGARSRLMFKTGGAIVCNIFAVVGVLGITFVAYYSLSYLYGWLYAEAPPTNAANPLPPRCPPPPTPAGPHPPPLRDDHRARTRRPARAVVHARRRPQPRPRPG